KYLVSGKLLMPARSMALMLENLMERNKSQKEPSFKNLVVKPAYGPKSNSRFSFIHRVSKCGTDMGGEPTAARPYTLARCCSITASLVQRNHCPLTGKPP